MTPPRVPRLAPTLTGELSGGKSRLFDLERLFREAAPPVSLRGAATATVIVAAGNSSARSKAAADLICDGTDDDLVAYIQASKLLPLGGGDICLLEGDYYFSGDGGEVSTDFLTIRGMGAVVHLPRGGFAPYLTGSATTVESISFKCDREDGSGSDNTVAWYSSAFPNNGIATLRNCILDSCSAYPGNGAVIEGCLFRGVEEYPIYAYEDVVVTGCTFYNVVVPNGAPYFAEPNFGSFGQGVIYCGRATITGCKFLAEFTFGDTPGDRPDGKSHVGSLVYAFDPTVIADCIVAGSIVVHDAIFYADTLTVVGCDIEVEQVGDPDEGFGAGLYCSAGRVSSSRIQVVGGFAALYTGQSIVDCRIDAILDGEENAGQASGFSMMIVYAYGPGDGSGQVFVGNTITGRIPHAGSGDDPADFGNALKLSSVEVVASNVLGSDLVADVGIRVEGSSARGTAVVGNVVAGNPGDPLGVGIHAIGGAEGTIVGNVIGNGVTTDIDDDSAGGFVVADNKTL